MADTLMKVSIRHVMKRNLFIPVFLGAVFLSASSLFAQLRDDMDSYNQLAVQCLISARLAGRTDVSLSDYENYAVSLAKTISSLSVEQQNRVFGSGAGRSATSSASTSNSPARSVDSADIEFEASGLFSDIGNVILKNVGDFNDFIAGKSADAPVLLGVSVEPASSPSEIVDEEAFAGTTDTEGDVAEVAEVKSKNKPKNIPNGNAFGWWEKNGDTADIETDEDDDEASEEGSKNKSKNVPKGNAFGWREKD